MNKKNENDEMGNPFNVQAYIIDDNDFGTQLKLCQEQMVKAMQPFIELEKVLSESLKPLRMQLENLDSIFGVQNNIILNSFIGISDELNQLANIKPLFQQIKNQQESISMILSPLSEFQHNFSNLPERISDALISLAKKGWYFDLSFTLSKLQVFVDMIQGSNVDKVDEILCNYYEDKIDSIIEFIEANYSNRSIILRAALEAHRRGEFSLSVPVILMQVDGICKEVTTKYFFKKKNKQPEMASYINDLSMKTIVNSIVLAFLKPIGQVLPINMSEHERDENFVGLNRHAIFHGESTDYGKRENSCKVISLLNYLIQVLNNI